MSKEQFRIMLFLFSFLKIRSDQILIRFKKKEKMMATTL